MKIQNRDNVVLQDLTPLCDPVVRDLLLTSIVSADVSADFLKFALPLFCATVAWLINEWKRIWEQVNSQCYF